MAELTHARLVPVEVTDKGVKPVKVGDLTDTGFEVQFNPASLRLSRSNNTSGQPGQRATQATGNDTTLTVDLLFDTADEGETGAPVDVRTRTGRVATFVLPAPAKDKSKKAPPGVRFVWGSVDIAGVMTNFTEDIDLFSSEGIALRAKVSITIKEQDPLLMSLRRGAGAADGHGATPPGAEPAAPGTSGSAAPDTTAFAQAGETMADLANRMGLPPEAWRALDVANDALGSATGAINDAFGDVNGAVGALNDVLGSTAGLGGGIAGALAVGARVDFDSSVSVAGGLGGAAVGGFASGTSDADAGATIVAGASTSMAPSEQRAAGFALAAAGGPTAALEASMRRVAEQGAANARQAFGASGERAAGPAAVRNSRPVTDPRAATFGSGVPLRPLRSDRDDAGRSPFVVIGAQPASPVTAGPAPVGTAPWTYLGPVPPAVGGGAGGSSPTRCRCGCGDARSNAATVGCGCGCGCEAGGLGTGGRP